jgi:thiosulfate/3-mercaptopyruvate sulfurtransferase
MSASASPLIDPATLASELAGDCAPVLLDVRWRLGGPPGFASYLAGHLPGAVFVDLDRDLAGPPGAGGRHPLPGAAMFQAAMRRAGVNSGRPVVAYDDGDSIAAARAWWTLRYFGHQQVRVLNGGFSAWVAAGLPVTAAGPAAAAEPVPPGSPVTGDVPVSSEVPATLGAGTCDFTAVPGGMPVLDVDGAAELARSGILLDVRTAERYRGETEPIDPVAGHIPGALSAPVAGSMTAGGRFLPPADLAERFTALGAVAGRQVGAYCGSGVTAAHEVLALALAGVPAALYVGSWSGWVADPGRPVATGPDPG